MNQFPPEARTTPSEEYPEDHYIHGKIIKFFPHANYGFIRDTKGKEVYFHLDEVRLLNHFHRKNIKEGLLVGFDISRTARGQRATRIKVYTLSQNNPV